MTNTPARRALLANRTLVVAALMRTVTENVDLDQPGVGPIVTASVTPELNGSPNAMGQIPKNHSDW